MTDTKEHRGLWCSSSGFLDKQGNCRNPDGCACDVIARLERERDEARAKGEATARLALSLEVEADERIAVAEVELTTLRARVARLEEALEPMPFLWLRYGALARSVGDKLAIDMSIKGTTYEATITVCDLRRMLAALTEEQKP